MKHCSTNLFIFLVHFRGDFSLGGSRRGIRKSARIGCMSDRGGSPEFDSEN